MEISRVQNKFLGSFLKASHPLAKHGESLVLILMGKAAAMSWPLFMDLLFNISRLVFYLLLKIASSSFLSFLMFT